jgi:hypothetical protein
VTADVEVHTVVEHMVDPSMTVGVESSAARLVPMIVTGTMPLVAEFGLSSIEMIGVSYEKQAPLVPMAVFTTAVTGSKVPVPGAITHFMDVIDTHSDDAQLVEPIEIVDDSENEPKLFPMTVRVVPAVTAVLDKTSSPVPACETVTVCVLPDPVTVGAVVTAPMFLYVSWKLEPEAATVNNKLE